MSVHTATPGDVYRDKSGNLWVVRWTCHEPTVCVARLHDKPFDEAEIQSGGVSGLMWHGFEKLEKGAGA